MTHTIDGVTYHGFQRVSNPTNAPIDTILIIAWFDGEPDLWAAENLDGVESLRRYYRADWGDRDIPFTLSVVRDEHTGWLFKKSEVNV